MGETSAYWGPPNARTRWRRVSGKETVYGSGAAPNAGNQDALFASAGAVGTSIAQHAGQNQAVGELEASTPGAERQGAGTTVGNEKWGSEGRNPQRRMLGRPLVRGRQRSGIHLDAQESSVLACQDAPGSMGNGCSGKDGRYTALTGTKRRERWLKSREANCA